ncbi:hypothetical protein F5148DRAFT_980784 [Russula earlei]|uniref:Uncharacterized protein n=1 Tax=Russula earlei TaxID=71964 RepID=A0ACC0U8L6_9AGAM|nr:hypothetical protein F5148DRAFT_980784 [Russula earlei]
MSQGVPAEAAAEQLFLAEWVRVYEEKWAVLRGVVPVVEQLRFCDVPWPLFGNVQSVEDITVERVLEFVCHPLNECIRGASAGQTTKSLRSEMLRWHPDKFGKVLERVVEGDREVVMMAAGNVARILTKLNAEVR